MSAANVKQLDSAAKIRPVKPGQLYVFGKISSVDKFQLKSKEVRYRTRVLMKDDTDDFAYPMPVDVVANAPLGAAGELWDDVVTIKTFKKDYITKPDDNGEQKKIKQLTLECYYES